MSNDIRNIQSLYCESQYTGTLATKRDFLNFYLNYEHPEEKGSATLRVTYNGLVYHDRTALSDWQNYGELYMATGEEYTDENIAAAKGGQFSDRTNHSLHFKQSRWNGPYASRHARSSNDHFFVTDVLTISHTKQVAKAGRGFPGMGGRMDLGRDDIENTFFIDLQGKSAASTAVNSLYSYKLLKNPPVITTLNQIAQVFAKPENLEHASIEVKVWANADHLLRARDEPLSDVVESGALPCFLFKDELYIRTPAALQVDDINDLPIYVYAGDDRRSSPVQDLSQHRIDHGHKSKEQQFIIGQLYPGDQFSPPQLEVSHRTVGGTGGIPHVHDLKPIETKRGFERTRIVQLKD